MNNMILDSSIWGPHYWFFLHTISLIYPKNPNTLIKKRYFDFIQNFSMFLPNEQISKHFDELLNNYPVSPYLDSRDSFIRWVHFIHNKINEKLEKPKISLEEFYISYYDFYKPKEVKIKEFYKLKKKIIFSVLLLFILVIIIWLYIKM